jgi:hypothetical protein
MPVSRVRTGAPRRAPRGLLTIGVLVLLAGCRLGNTAHAQLIVDFDSADATAARTVVRTGCGTLPGIKVVPPRSHDVSVYFDIQHASARQVNALDACVNALATSRPDLGIRGYRIDDGSQT